MRFVSPTKLLSGILAGWGKGGHPHLTTSCPSFSDPCLHPEPLPGVALALTLSTPTRLLGCSLLTSSLSAGSCVPGHLTSSVLLTHDLPSSLSDPLCRLKVSSAPDAQITCLVREVFFGSLFRNDPPSFFFLFAFSFPLLWEATAWLWKR